VPGFGAEFETIVVPGFGEPLAVAAFGSLNTTASAAATSTVSEPERRFRGENPRDRDDEERGGRGRGRGRGGDRDEDRGRSEPSTATVTSSTTPGTQTAASPSRGGNENDRIRRIAQAMLNRYDENKDGTLQKDEWSKMSNEPEKGDKNGDGLITLDEMAERLGEWRPGGSTSPSGSSTSIAGASAGQTSTGSESSGGRGNFGGRGRGRGGFGRRDASTSRPATTSSGQSYRFLTPKERLPEGLPDFFANDRDNDGQVSMAEYASSWTEARLAEFNRWDLNGDGLITPAESLRSSSR
jgi:hypothetical protein